MALLEAAATGLPIVCTSEVGLGLPDWIVREEFDAGNVDGGVAAVRRVLEDFDAFQARAISQAPRVLEEYGARVCAERYLDVFDRLVRASSRELETPAHGGSSFVRSALGQRANEHVCKISGV